MDAFFVAVDRVGAWAQKRMVDGQVQGRDWLD